ncbi:DNA damage-inducible protein 1, partial [Spiromyces aspiralis]
SESAEVILGLDMLKRFQVNIDLKNNALVVNDEKIPFLHEYEIRQMDEEDGIVDSAAVSVAPNAQTPPGPGKARAAAVTTTVGPVSAPDAVRSGGLAAAAAAAAASPARQRHSQEKIRLLVDLGATEEEAIRLLDQAKGNADLAASIFFG